LYSVAGLDRVNLSNARVAGMNVDLGFNIGDRYTIALLVFFITYFIFEIPTVLSMRWIGPKWLLNTLAICWGSVMVGMGWVSLWFPVFTSIITFPSTYSAEKMSF
jgi:hypothetical protein